MDVIDFGRSFCTFVSPRNRARLQVESQLEMIDDGTGASEVYLLYASCKAEDTYAAECLFLEPNYDFCGIFSASAADYSIIRVHATHQDNLETGRVADRFSGLDVHLTRADAQPLATTEAIIAATLRGDPLVARVELAAPDRPLRAVVDCPVKTMNVNPDTGMFQVDTGPMLYPDFTHAAERPIEWLQQAYVAFNRPDRVEFIIQAPTPVVQDGRELCQVTHYSRIAVHESTNTIFSIQ